MSNSESWKPLYDEGLALFRKGDFAHALTQLSQAIESSSQPVFQLFDSRAAVYEKLGRPKDAIKDAKKIIDIAPQQWIGYYRSAKLFHTMLRHRAALTMTKMALDRLQPGPQNDTRRRAVLELQTTVVLAQEEAIRASTNHIANLPFELLSLIFQYSYDSPASSVCLSHVCSHWRSVALSSPALWKTLSLSKPAKATLKIRAWCTRSKGCISRLQIRKRFGEALFTSLSYNPQGVRQVVQELSDLHWASLKSVALEGAELTELLPALHVIGQANFIENLESFEWTGTTKASFPLDRSHRAEDSLDTSSPLLLRTLILRSMRCQWAVLATQARSLVTLELYDHVREDNQHLIRDVLAANESLAKVIIHFSEMGRFTSDTLTSYPTPSITLAHLRHLELKNWSSPGKIFTGVCIPALETLRLYHISAGSSFLRVLNDDPSATWANLEELVVHATVAFPNDILPILNRSYSLQSLQLSSMSGLLKEVTQVLSETAPAALMQISPRPPIPCPSLRHINFSRSAHFSIGPLFRMASTRLALAESAAGDETGSTQPVAKLETIVLDDCPDIEVDYIPKLRSLVPAVRFRSTG